MPEPSAVAPGDYGTGEGMDPTPERQRSLFSWAEFMAQESPEPKPRRRCEAPTLSLHYPPRGGSDASHE